MPDWKTDYNEFVLNARNSIMGKGGTAKETYLQMYRAVAQALVDFDEAVSKGRVTDIRSPILRRNLGRMLEGLKQTLPKIMESGLDEATGTAIRAHIVGMQNAIRATGTEIPNLKNVIDNFEKLKTNALSYVPMRQGLDPNFTYRTYLNLGITNLRREIDLAIASGIQRGIPADEFTKELALKMSKNDPEFNKVLQNLGPRGGKLRNGMKNVNIPKDQVRRAKSFLYQARRIAVSEVNNAYNEADLLATREATVVGYNEWQVSGRHYGLPSTPDACTFNYEVDQFGLGEGVFHVETTPSLLHPFCGCYTLKIFREPEEWDTEREPPPPLKEHNERGYRRFFKGKSTAHRNRNLDLVNEKNKLAYEFLEEI